ncbi:unnamed protein product [Polarella glacialis]|uniref:Uncharacterized protein n=1 Tax=Polarella glacialis TaxID=89957 RepID=A0A813L208_POLGL|nr:unnamed protein product [Polarella glacialis]CAE8616946.1 unnamed protein product [Polarella glacialis]CAE8713473.1 unnamed protein product [Polarella glacialis]|mmetsp:Transcript_54268/g.87664  ORF Transcript_54268/g.87664 Transcript_54268/m.87664 type:complete len:142 (-) Transcript_54268:79-504(-)
MTQMGTESDCKHEKISGCCPSRLRIQSCSKRCGRRLWNQLPQRWQERLKPYYTQLLFWMMCAKWAISFVWEDRREILRELWRSLLEDLWAADGRPPCKRSKVRDELRPFTYVLVAGLLYSSWDMASKVAFRVGPPMDLSLD